jgi:hypothetical protein
MDCRLYVAPLSQHQGFHNKFPDVAHQPTVCAMAVLPYDLQNLLCLLPEGGFAGREDSSGVEISNESFRVCVGSCGFGRLTGVPGGSVVQLPRIDHIKAW